MLTWSQATSQRAKLFPGVYDFPAVPSTPAAFIAAGLTTRPAFFGCNGTTTAPLVIYLANGGPPRSSSAFVTNTSTLQDIYLAPQLQTMLDQTWDIATQGLSASSSGDVDPSWPACLACAMVDRARDRSGITRSGTCASCFDRYCWSEDTTSS